MCEAFVFAQQIKGLKKNSPQLEKGRHRQDTRAKILSLQRQDGAVKILHFQVLIY